MRPPSCVHQDDGDGLPAPPGGEGSVVSELRGPLPYSGATAGATLGHGVPKGQKVRSSVQLEHNHFRDIYRKERIIFCSPLFHKAVDKMF